MLAFGSWVSIDDVAYSGITELAQEDLAHAREFDLALKLVGTAERIDGGISVRVHPMFLPGAHPLARVDGSSNAVTIESPHVNEITLQGPGAGGVPTASAVLGDVVSVLQGAVVKAKKLKARTEAVDVVNGIQQYDSIYGRFPVSAATTEVERYCVWPGQACGYMIGKLTFLRLRDKANAALGPRFDIRKFHDAVLLSGALPLAVLEKVVDDFIARNKR